jgi:hypothetical protein
VLPDYGHEQHVIMEEIAGPAGEPCLNCGHIAGPVTPSVCPNCRFREIAPCPQCHQEVARQEYISVAGDLYRCPRCITLAPKKLIRTRRASEGSASEPSLARRVSMCKDAKLSCRGNNTHVRLRFNDPLIHADGIYNQPVVAVDVAAQQPV